MVISRGDRRAAPGTPTDTERPAIAWWRDPSALGLAVAALLMAASVTVPVAFGWDVHAGFGPLTAHWAPRVGLSSLTAVAISVLALTYGFRVSARLSWTRLLVVSWLAAVGWLLSLSLVDGRAGVSTRFDTADLMGVARRTGDISHLLYTFASRIPIDADGSWPVHVAGHPPGAVLFFLVLARLGFSDLGVGLTVAALAALVPAGVLVTLRTLGAEASGRAVAPFLVVAPAAIWEAVSADAVFACLACWALACLAVAAVRRSIALSVLAGMLLGVCALMSYGLPLLAFLALAVLVAARCYQPLPWALGGALLVVAAFMVAGFSLVEAYPVLRARYWDGIAADRPAAYWLWGNLAALCFSAGPVVGAGVACWFQRRRALRSGSAAEPATRIVLLLGSAAMLTVLVADASLMSKAEVERIWLPFVPWLLVLTALLPHRWRRPALAAQLVVALAVQHLLRTAW